MKLKQWIINNHGRIIILLLIISIFPLLAHITVEVGQLLDRPTQKTKEETDIIHLSMRLKISEEYTDKLEKSIKVKDKLIENQNDIITLQETAVKILKDEVRLYNSLINKQKEIVDRYIGELPPQSYFYWANYSKQCLYKN
jgi:uncharacterized coiled-coil protein SlyX